MADETPRVGILMGSDSDWPVMKKVVDVLKRFGVAYEVNVMSAHRTPDDVAEYARGAHERGLQTLVAGAGMAAHLAGVVAAFTPLPVIGVPCSAKNLDGLDALLAMVQMPKGVPVATVAVDGGQNAGLLAVQILGTADADLREAFVAYKQELAEESRKRTVPDA